MKHWLTDRHCNTLYITPANPWENPFIESIIGTFRSECLDRWVFENGHEARIVIELMAAGIQSASALQRLGYVPPAAFAQQARLSLSLDPS